MYGNTGTSMGLFDKLDRRSAQNIGEVSSLFTANRGMRMRYSNGGLLRYEEYADMTDDEYWQALSERYAHRDHPILKNKKALIKKYGQEWWDKYRGDLDEKAREFDLSEKGKERLLGFEEANYYKANPHIRSGNPQFEMYTQFGYDPAFLAEQERREKEAYHRSLTEDWRKDGMSYNEWHEAQGTGQKRMTDEEWAVSADNPANLKNPWEKGYTGWYDDDEQLTSGRTGKEQYWYEANEDVISRGGTPSDSHIELAGGTQGVSPDSGKITSTPSPGVKMRVTPAGGGGGFGQSSAFQNLSMDSLSRPGTAGTGGGATGAEANLMEDNRFLDMNPYITENVRAFNYGGKMRKPKYNYGGKIPKYNYGGATHTMPDGTVHPGATHQEYVAMMGGNEGRIPMYGHGGMHEQRANETIAINQIANLMGGVSSPYMADKGMKYKYNHGGQHNVNPMNPYTSMPIEPQQDNTLQINPYDVNPDQAEDFMENFGFHREQQGPEGPLGSYYDKIKAEREEAERLRRLNARAPITSERIDRDVLTRYTQGGRF